jgi:hypothetical protein
MKYLYYLKFTPRENLNSKVGDLFIRAYIVANNEDDAKQFAKEVLERTVVECKRCEQGHFIHSDPVYISN